jgi:hypothetical protein
MVKKQIIGQLSFDIFHLSFGNGLREFAFK